MAKDKQLPDQPQTMEDYLLSQLEEQVVLKDGSTLKGQDGHVMTMTGLSVDFPLRAVELNLPVNREAADSELCSPEHLRSARSQRAKISRIRELENDKRSI